MVSTELLRRYPFFRELTSAQLSAVAALADEIAYEPGALLFEQNTPASKLCLLLAGSVDLFVMNEGQSTHQRELVVGEISPGEAFGLSAVVEPHQYRAAARASARSRVLTLQAKKLQALFVSDPQLKCQLIQRVAETAMERLYSTQVQLAAGDIESPEP